MKLLHDFALLRFSRQLWAARRLAQRQAYRVTVPAPHRQADAPVVVAVTTRAAVISDHAAVCAVALRAGSAIPLSLRQ